MPVQLLQEYALTLEWGLKKQSHKLRMVSDTIHYSQGAILKHTRNQSVSVSLTLRLALVASCMSEPKVDRES